MTSFLQVRDSMEDVKLKVRVVAPHWFVGGRFDGKVLKEVLFSTSIPLDEANGLVVVDDPTAELMDFNGPKLWFSSGPSWHAHYNKHAVGRWASKYLKPSERAWHSHPDPVYRVPHPTHWYINPTLNEDRMDKAVSIVSNYGGRIWYLKKHFRLRNRFILNDLVDLYGNPSSWQRFRKPKTYFKKGPPLNYKGAVEKVHSSNATSIRHLMSKYKVAVCMENIVEGWYFTEKLVNACIPVYHASPAVKDTFLSGAKWVDQEQFGFRAMETLSHVLE